jgi:transcriptional regulator with PAS, ATPase and Fis domain
MKEIAIFTYSEEAANIYYDELYKLLKSKIKLTKYSVEKNTIDHHIGADLLLIASYDLYGLIEKYVPDEAQVMIPNRTILKSSFQQIQNLPAGTKALLVNAHFEFAVQSVEQIYQFGARHIELIPYSPYFEAKDDITVAITPGETQNVPKWVKKVINIGHRVIDISTIVNILICFNIEELFNTREMKAYYTKIIPYNANPRFINRIHQFNLNDYFIANYRRGIIGFQPNGKILIYNSVAEKILGHKKKSVLGKNVFSLFPEPIIRETIKNLKPQQKKQIKINGQDLLVDVNVESVMLTKVCYLVFERIRESAIQIPNYKKQAIGHGYVAKYHFKDIITQNEEFINLKRIARLNSAFDSSILILGESGTGKELFAQAIHNASERRDHPFVAINCAAVSENLLESELFGYDEGAFTGARRGGKKGLFELAHSGTLFLDEIGEMKGHLQARLLRVLQEKEITHIGGNMVISVDVRVIAATNCDITQLIRNGSFRKDLYYRLNVITLKLPGLRERLEDIPILIEAFKKEMKANFTMQPDVIKAFQTYGWEGNVRELRNYIEYFKNLQKSCIGVNDIPFLQNRSSANAAIDHKDRDLFGSYIKKLGDSLPEAVFILDVLEQARMGKKRLGRRSIAELSHEKFQYLSEMKIRSLLSQLGSIGLIMILKGRGGTQITEEGIRFLHNAKISGQAPF